MRKLPQFSSKVFLAPMAGITDSAFRLLCKEEGAGLVITELTSIHAIVAKERLLQEKNLPITDFIPFSEDERPVAVQLFGNDIDLAVRSAKIVEPYFDIIDFNMGCPAPHITQQMAGAALLQKTDHVRKLFSALVNSVHKPVTLKLRAGIKTTNPHLYRDIAKIAEDCGINMITLHARTLEQGYSGQANWNLIKELKELVNIPIVGNGDVKTPEDAKRMMDETGCDYVMIGRAAMGNPSLFRQCQEYFSKESYTQVTVQEKIASFLKYLALTEKFSISPAAIKVQAMQFSHGMKGAPAIRRQISTCNTIAEFRDVFSHYDDR